MSLFAHVFPTSSFLPLWPLNTPDSEYKHLIPRASQTPNSYFAFQGQLEIDNFLVMFHERFQNPAPLPADITSNLHIKIKHRNSAFPLHRSSAFSVLWNLLRFFTTLLKSSGLLFWAYSFLCVLDIFILSSSNSFLCWLSRQNKHSYTVVTVFPTLPKILFSLKVPNSFHMLVPNLFLPALWGNTFPLHSQSQLKDLVLSKMLQSPLYSLG